MSIDISALLEASTFEDGDQTFVTMHDAVAKAIDPDLFARVVTLEWDVIDDDREWLYGKADAVIDALNTLGFLTIPGSAA